MMAKKITDVYSVEIARKKLSKHFDDNIPLLEITSQLQDNLIIALAAMCDGYTITTPGNNIDADYALVRATTKAGDLLRKHNLPITTEIINAESYTGRTTPYARYSIAQPDLERLLDDTESVLHEISMKNISDKQSRDVRTLDKLISNYGVTNVFNYVSELKSSRPSGGL
ncbi:hypothetical protein ABN063_20270 [Providencia vermicola]|uniref:hypothetical protein n=2 Tax=Providencia vermicola TaxID=333965 RepID=UPI0032DC8B1F